MTTNRDWLHRLKDLKREPRALSNAECDELILLLGGTIRPNHRPEITVFGMNRRHLNWGGIASVVFSFLENAERLAKLKAELLELEQPDWLENATKEVSVTMTDAEARRMAMEYREAELLYLTSAIETLRPISAKNRAAAERMAVKWFADRGVTFSKKQIENALTALQQSAELKRLGLAEWRALNPMK